jgi:YrbI family 3-deoxy-D-manno-octulosonate 8-phosphate phosphatase
MEFLEQNIKGLSARFGVDYYQMLQDFNVESVGELSLIDLQTVAEEYEVDLYSLLFKPLVIFDHLAPKVKKIKFVILDVDGVMTDGGMYFMENGDQMKKYNTKDGMAIMKAQEKGMRFGIISSGFTGEMVRRRADVLKIGHVYIGRDPKLGILEAWCTELGIDFSEVAMIGDDINDTEVMKKVGFAACPVDAVQEIKVISDVVLQKKGGKGVVREFVDQFIMPQL